MPVHFPVRFLVIVFVFQCAFATRAFAQKSDRSQSVKLDTLTWMDTSRHRPIPVAFFTLQREAPVAKQRVVILNHGYGQNMGGGYIAYSSVANKLATEGYFVASIQHELPTDSLLPMKGVPQVVRRPFWDRGADNILFVINQLRANYPTLDFKHITLIGHSNGGDMVALFPQKYPGIAGKVITLDNRRMALPRGTKPRIYSLRSSDQPADEGVLPTEAEVKVNKITIVKLPNTNHNDMDDSGTESQKKEINDYLLRFLAE